LYFLNWVGSTYSANSGNGTLVRYAYTGTQVSVERAISHRMEGVLRDRLFAAVSGGVFSLPAGSYGADFHALDGKRLWRFRRTDASGKLDLPLPAEVRGVVRVRLLER
jgi:hypothetical protein